MVTPDPARIQAFPTSKAFDLWMRKNHADQREIYVRIYKVGSGVPSVTVKEALDVALCWGWIDGLRKAYDAESYLQRYTPRTSKSPWSQINRDHVARLIDAGRMTKYGVAQIEAAKADGRWDRAYAGSASMQMPEDLVAAIKSNAKALATYQTLNSQNRYALAFRLHHLKTEAARERNIARYVEQLARGELFHPVKQAKKTPRKKS